MKKKQLNKERLRSKFLIVFKMLPSSFIEHLKSFLLITGFILLGNLNSNAQTYPKIHQSYKLIEENHKDMVEVSVMVAQCDSTGSDSVYVMIFNEKPVSDTVEFELFLYKHDKSDSTSKSFSYNCGIAEMAIPSCGNGSLRSLVFALPSGYDPEKVTFSVKFK